MSTKYFILTKPNNCSCIDDTETQIININKKNTFLMPEVNLTYYLNHGLFEKNIIEWSKQLCSLTQTILDIGAHTGSYTISLSPFAKEVYSFEPQKMTYYALCGSVALSNAQNVTCLKIGLGSQNQIGTQKLKIRSNDGGGSSLHDELNDTILTTEDIDVDTLDNVVSYNKITNIGFIKMDAEYNELNILKGAVNTIINNNFPKILFESNKTNEQLFNFLKDIGYKKIVSVYGSSNMFLACQE